ncbi:MAG: hypothetical protein M3N97_04665 [Pseudomonadota bacterium]|nr:hypothetical protein [Pseudomonadota bacterium]
MTLLTAAHGGPLYSAVMEWVLQLVDELDDAIGMARHGWLGVHAQIGVLCTALGALAVTACRTLGTRRPALRARPH